MSNERLIVDALLKTDEALFEMVDGNNDFKDAVLKRGARVALYRNYERGDHRSNLTAEQRKLMNILADTAELNESSANYCSIVIDMMAGRLAVSEIVGEDDVVNEWIESTLQRNRFGSSEGQYYRGAIRDAESYVLVDPLTGLWSAEAAYDGFAGIVAIYDEMTGLPIWACRLWVVAEASDISSDSADVTDSRTVKIAVYQPDKVTFWKGEVNGSTVEKVTVEKREGYKVLDSENGYEWPIGVIPIGQFANKRDNYTPYGESEIRVVVPLQDILNSTLYDMQMASKLSAFKIYYSIGMEIDKDGIVPGSVINLVLKDASGNIVTNLTQEQAEFLKSVKVGELGTTDMTQYTNQLDKLEREISQVSSTPVYGITAQGNLSGEALKQLEIGLVGKIIRFQRENSDTLKMLLRLTAEIQNQFNVNVTFTSKFRDSVRRFLNLTDPMKPPRDLGAITVNWRSPEIIDVSKQIDTLSQLRLDNPGLWPDEWYRERIGGLLGMTQGQITEEGDKAGMQASSSLDTLLGVNNVPVV